MEKTFEVDGIAHCTLILKGMAIKPSFRFKQNMTESEFNAFKNYMEVLSCTEVGIQKSEPVEEKTKIEPKGEEKNVELHKPKSRRTIKGNVAKSV